MQTTQPTRPLKTFIGNGALRVQFRSGYEDQFTNVARTAKGARTLRCTRADGTWSVYDASCPVVVLLPSK